MITIESVVWIVLFLIGCAAIFGLLWWAVCYCEKEFPGGAPFFKFARIFLVIAAVFILIFLILDLLGHPVVTWRRLP